MTAVLICLLVATLILVGITCFIAYKIFDIETKLDDLIYDHDTMQNDVLKITMALKFIFHKEYHTNLDEFYQIYIDKFTEKAKLIRRKNNDKQQ